MHERIILFVIFMSACRSELTAKDDMMREQERSMKEHRKKKKERKIKKRAKLGRSCYLEKMNCFSHDKDHWRTPPFWTGTCEKLFEIRQKYITRENSVLFAAIYDDALGILEVDSK